MVKISPPCCQQYDSFSVPGWVVQGKVVSIPVSMQSRPEVVYDSPNLGHNVTVGGRRWVYLLWSTCPRDEGGLPLIKGDGFQ